MPKITIQEASDLLGVHPDTMRRWETEGKTEPLELVVVKQVLKQKIETSRNGSKLPVTYEIVRRGDNLYINATIEVLDPVITTSRELHLLHNPLLAFA